MGEINWTEEGERFIAEGENPGVVKERILFTEAVARLMMACESETALKKLFDQFDDAGFDKDCMGSAVMIAMGDVSLATVSLDNEFSDERQQLLQEGAELMRQAWRVKTLHTAESDDADLAWGTVVMGTLKEPPVVYLLELESGIWHWVGKCGENGELPKDLETFTPRVKCGAIFHIAPPEIVHLYAKLTPKVDQRWCVDCKFDPKWAVPTLYSGDERLGPDDEPPDPRPNAT